MSTRHDPIGGVFDDLAQLRTALRRVRIQATHGTPRRTDLVRALRAGERAQAGLFDLLLAELRPIEIDLAAGPGGSRLRAGRETLASGRQTGRATEA